MNSCCLQYYIIPDESSTPDLVETPTSQCSDCSCHCGYIQYESLAPDMPKLMNNFTDDGDHILVEAKLRRQIIEISRLFDAETKASDGFYSKAHTKIVRLIGNGTKHLEIPDFVEGTLQLYTDTGYLINPATYIYKDGFLILDPCRSHTSTCGCNSSCGMYNKSHDYIGWRGCFKAKAKFGKECADYAVQMAVRAYLIEFNTFGDQKQAIKDGFTIARSFKRPDVWNTLVAKYLEGKRLQSYFGFA